MQKSLHKITLFLVKNSVGLQEKIIFRLTTLFFKTLPTFKHPIIKAGNIFFQSR